MEEEDGTLAAVALWEPGKPSCAGILRGTLGIAIPWWRSKGRLFSWAKLLFALEAKREELASAVDSSSSDADAMLQLVHVRRHIA